MEKRPPAKVGVLKNNPLSNFVIQPSKKKRTILRATKSNLQIKRDYNLKALYRLIETKNAIFKVKFWGMERNYGKYPSLAEQNYFVFELSLKILK